VEVKKFNLIENRLLNKFKRRHTANTIGSEMYDDELNNYNSNEEENKYQQYQDQEQNFDPQHDSSDFPNIDSPRLTDEIRQTRTLTINNNPDLDEGEIPQNSEESPEVPNENSSIGFIRKASSNTSQGDYEVIGDNIIRNTIPLKRNESEERDYQNPSKIFISYTSDNTKYAKTDKGFSEISQLK